MHKVCRFSSRHSSRGKSLRQLEEISSRLSRWKKVMSADTENLKQVKNGLFQKKRVLDL